MFTRNSFSKTDLRPNEAVKHSSNVKHSSHSVTLREWNNDGID
ncbi:unnamed protein product [Tenebrio molitor]|nr:unnamed protein product [Tenebrio molitor]